MNISWRDFLSTEHLSEYLSLADIALALIGFAITATVAFQAKSAAIAARDASERARYRLLHFDLVAELATTLQLIEELKRLNRSKAAELLPEKYSSLRTKLVAIRETGERLTDDDREAIQDAVARLAFLEKSMDRSNDGGSYADKQFARANESLTICSDVIVACKERIRIRGGGEYE